MLDIRWMRENREALAAAMAKLNATDAPWEEALALDEQRRQILTQVESLRAERNTGSKRVGELYRNKQNEEANAVKVRMSTVGGEIERLDADLRKVEADFADAMLRIPNPPEADVPEGADDSQNTVIFRAGREAELRLRAAGPLGSGTEAGHHRLRSRRQAGRQPFLSAEGRRARGCSGRLWTGSSMCT